MFDNRGLRHATGGAGCEYIGDGIRRRDSGGGGRVAGGSVSNDGGEIFKTVGNRLLFFIGQVIKFLIGPQSQIADDFFEGIDNFLADNIDLCRMQGQAVFQGILAQVGVDHGVDHPDFGHCAVDDEKFRAIFDKDTGHISFSQTF